MEIMTKRRALENTLEIWDELARTGDWKKPDDAWIYAHGCPCCDYVIQETAQWDPEIRAREGHMRCANGENPQMLTLCPLFRIWKGGCCSETSPYSDWIANIGGPSFDSPEETNKRKEIAKKIADGARAELALLDASEL